MFLPCLVETHNEPVMHQHKPQRLSNQVLHFNHVEKNNASSIYRQMNVNVYSLPIN